MAEVKIAESQFKNKSFKVDLVTEDGKATANPADDAWVAKAKTPEEKKARVDMLGWLIAFNGSLEQTVGGVARSYINPKHFYNRVEGLRGVEHMVTECALNYRALDKGPGGVLGANLRWALRANMVPQRETVIHRIDADHVPKEIDDLVAEYEEAFAKVKDLAVNVVANSNNIVALGGALMMSVGHHFDSQNRKPQIALLSALGLKDDITDENIRKVFYLAVHPIPLGVSERMRKEAADGEVTGYSEAVKVRARAIPAGYASLAICAAAAIDLRGEKYWDAIASKYHGEFEAMTKAVGEMKADPTSYHVQAADFGKKRIVFDIGVCKNAMVICAAFILECIKGSMSEAASLRKFVNMNSRQVAKWRTAFAAESEKAIRSVADLLQ